MNLKRQILLIDDDAGIRSSLSRILKLDEYEVDAAASIQEALDRDNWQAYFAILLDRKLPDGSADELLPQLIDLAPDAAILIVTAHADLESSIAALRLGAADYLLKPVEPELLRARLSQFASLHEARSELRLRDEQMRFMVQHLPATTAYVNRSDRSLMFNNRIEQLTGYSSQDLTTIDAAFEAFFGLRCAAELKNYEIDVTKGLIDPRTVEIEREGGGRRVVEFHRYAYDEHEVWLLYDVTNRRRTQERLVQSERLAAIGQMVAGLAHESRNALQRAQACLDMLELDLQQQPEQLELTVRARAALADLHRLYEEVRNYSAPITLERYPSDLASIWRKVWDDMALTLASKQVEFIENTHGIDLTFQLDPYRIEQVFRNILENAITACPDPGQIIVTCVKTDSAVDVHVQDNGAGFDVDAPQDVFEPFFTTRQKGTGLGLAIAKRIVEMHGGGIEIGQPASGGGEVVITLPLECEDRPPISPGFVSQGKRS